MVALFKDYPLKKTTDCRSAMAETLRDYVAGLEFSAPRTTKKFRMEAVFDTWSDFSQRAMSAGGKLPAAAALPDRPVYEDSSFGPRSIEDTWSGGDPNLLKADGVTKRFPIGTGNGDGFILVEVAQMMVPFVLVVRAKNKPQRKAIVSILEESFIEAGTHLDTQGGRTPDVSLINRNAQPEVDRQPIRYGRLLGMPQYFNRKARFTLQSQQLLDSESTSSENRWLAQFEITGHAQVCAVRRVVGMNPRVEIVVDDLTDNRAGNAASP